MNVYSIRITDTITNRTDFKNSYRLEVRFMHGDADAYTDTVVKFSDYEPEEDEPTEGRTARDIVPTLNVLEGMMDIDRYGGLLTHKDVKALCEKHGADFDFIGDNFMTGDVCYEGNYARIDDYELTHFDYKGIERDVEILTDA